MIEIAIPVSPTAIPKITTKPSFPKSPKEIIKIPKPGIKFESGIGRRIKEEKSKVKNPTILSARCVVMKDKRGLKILSTLPI